MREPVAIVDPALGWNGAHNAGFAALAVRESGLGPEHLGFWSSRKQVLGQHLNPIAGWTNVHPVFSVNFFDLSRATGPVADYWSWIYRLAREYEAALRDVATHWPGRRVRVIHHSLSWEHALALSAAIRVLGAAGDHLLHLCFLMYPPGSTPAKDHASVRNWVNRRLGFRSLAQCANTRLYANCAEYATGYADLLDWPEALPIHPLFLVGGRPRQRTDERDDKPRRTLMYLGPVRAEKGFSRLPERLRSAYAAARPGDVCVIQCYRLRVGDPAIRGGSLRELSAHCPGLELHEEFWDDATLTRQLDAADRLLLDYDADAYAHKTSGLLWLAAWFDLAVILPANTWLEREARRLAVRYALLNDSWPSEFVRSHPEGHDRDYRRVLFQRFWPWVMEQCPQISPQRWATGDQPP